MAPKKIPKQANTEKIILPIARNTYDSFSNMKSLLLFALMELLPSRLQTMIDPETVAQALGRLPNSHHLDVVKYWREVLENVEKNNVRCCVCFVVKGKEKSYKMKKCTHGICNDCFKESIEHGMPNCPVCRQSMIDPDDEELADTVESNRLENEVIMNQQLFDDVRATALSQRRRLGRAVGRLDLRTNLQRASLRQRSTNTNNNSTATTTNNSDADNSLPDLIAVDDSEDGSEYIDL